MDEHSRALKELVACMQGNPDAIPFLLGYLGHLHTTAELQSAHRHWQAHKVELEKLRMDSVVALTFERYDPRD